MEQRGTALGAPELLQFHRASLDFPCWECHQAGGTWAREPQLSKGHSGIPAHGGKFSHPSLSHWVESEKPCFGSWEMLNW